MNYKETLTLEWFEVLEKLPEDGDRIYFIVNKKVYIGIFESYYLTTGEKQECFSEEDADNYFHINEVTYWSYIPTIKGVHE